VTGAVCGSLTHHVTTAPDFSQPEINKKNTIKHRTIKKYILMNNEPSCNLKCVSDVYLPVQSSMEAILDWLPVRNTGSLPR